MYAELVHATGSGTNATVFTWILPPDVRIAVKRFCHSSNSYQDERSAYEAELRALSLLHHPNVVRHIGYCDEGPW